MIRAILLFAVVFCLAVPPVAAAVWPFTSKKEATPADQVPKVFNSPQGDPNKESNKWVLDGIFKQTLPGQDLVVNGITLKGIKAEMLSSTYTPKTPEEIMMIAYAHKGWEAGAMDEMEQKAQARIAEAKKQSDAALKKMEMEGAAQLAQAQQVGAMSKASDNEVVQQQQTEPVKKPATVIYNTPEIKEPTKVFKNYR